MIIGYTTGVFDMFHVGHLNILRRARQLCDHLIVGVSTDQLVESEKGHRPIVPFDERVEIVSAIRWVDQVVTQHDKDKLGAYHRLRFDKMFVGSDWKDTPQWLRYEQEFAGTGVEIIYLPYTYGTSSTVLREKLLNY